MARRKESKGGCDDHVVDRKSYKIAGRRIAPSRNTIREDHALDENSGKFLRDYKQSKAKKMGYRWTDGRTDGSGEPDQGGGLGDSRALVPSVVLRTSIWDGMQWTEWMEWTCSDRSSDKRRPMSIARQLAWQRGTYR